MEVIITIFSLIVLLLSAIMHELAHGSVALSLGDPTAKYEGRLTLNPLKHLDPFGSVILPLLLFLSGSPFLVGWAKPVPINPYNFRDQKWGTFKVSIAGPLTNFAIAIFFGLIIRFINIPQAIVFVDFLSIIVFLNLLLGIFNLVPIPPLDGSWILFKFLPESWIGVRNFLQQYGLFILIFFIFFGSSFLMSLVGWLYFIITGTYFIF
jgi:Zn-dependent protease